MKKFAKLILGICTIFPIISYVITGMLLFTGIDNYKDIFYNSRIFHIFLAITIIDYSFIHLFYLMQLRKNGERNQISKWYRFGYGFGPTAPLKHISYWYNYIWNKPEETK